MFGVGVGRYRLLIIVDLRPADGRAAAHPRRARASAAGCAPPSTTPRVARGLGINVNGVFALTFAFGSGLAGLGGALGAEILGLDPTFPLKYMIYFLIVVTVGGTSSITGPFLASLLLGIGDVAGKYYVPEARRLRHLHHHDRGADLAAAGPVRRARPRDEATRIAVTPAAGRRGRPPPRRPRALAPAGDRVLAARRSRRSSCCPSKHLILTEIAILALFALSLDLILGYAGIVSLGHAAFFGFGAYVAGLLAKHGIITEPLLACSSPGSPPRCSASSPASWCCAAPT